MRFVTVSVSVIKSCWVSLLRIVLQPSFSLSDNISQFLFCVKIPEKSHVYWVHTDVFHFLSFQEVFNSFRDALGSNTRLLMRPLFRHSRCLVRLREQTKHGGRWSGDFEKAWRYDSCLQNWCFTKQRKYFSRLEFPYGTFNMEIYFCSLVSLQDVNLTFYNGI